MNVINQNDQLKHPWMVAVWPGMGQVALAAGYYLMSKLGMKKIMELPSREYFDVDHIDVADGLATAGRLPQNSLYLWRDDAAKHDLLVFIGESQPKHNRYGFCHALIDVAEEMHVERVFTFAAMATQLHPSGNPRVFAAATDQQALNELKEFEAEPLEEGQIGGLNGVLLAAANERGLPGACLLGEMPFFAAQVPNPKASLAVLHVFDKLMGIELDLHELEEQAVIVESSLLELLERLELAQGEQKSDDDNEFSIPEVARQDEDTPGHDPFHLEPSDERRIEELFDKARRDRAQAVDLKRELDRHGVFKRYEDRFLDLFRKAE
ncbi:MAG: hypothetical protein GC159_04950 [Phycisphaera sp.]|nr:hypothetical protein [Phycisphaera sp.]